MTKMIKIHLVETNKPQSSIFHCKLDQTLDINNLEQLEEKIPELREFLTPTAEEQLEQLLKKTGCESIDQLAERYEAMDKELRHIRNRERFYEGFKNF